MIIKIRLFSFSLMLMMSFSWSLTFSQAPKYSNEFLSIGVGARALGMSNAQVATVGDATAGFWNPAGIAAIQSDLQLAAMHAEYFAGIAKFDYGTAAAPIDKTSAMGASFIRFGVDNIHDTSELVGPDGRIDYDKIKAFSAADYGFLFSYARKSQKIENLCYGANAKIVYRNVGEFASAWGFGLDAGAQYQLDKWRFGAMGKDITSTFNAWNFNMDKLFDIYTKTGNEIPTNHLEITLPKLILGAAYKYDFSAKIAGMGEMDLDVTFDGKRNVLIKGRPVSIDPHMGLEFSYDNIIFLRGGFGNIQQTKDFDGSKKTTIQPNIGVGVKLKNLYIDYALTNLGKSDATIGLYSHVFSLKLDIYKHK